MKKIIAVIRREFISRVRTKAFIISTLLLPAMFVVLFGMQFLFMTAGTVSTTQIALVDHSAHNIGPQVAEALSAATIEDSGKPRYEVKVYPVSGTSHELRDKLIEQIDATDKQGGESLDGVLVIHADTLETGLVNYYGANVGSMKSIRAMRSALSHALATIRLSARGLDPQAVTKLMRNAKLKAIKVSEGEITGQSGTESFILAYVMGFILYIAILIYGQQTMNSVIEEKTSRIMEVLASSLTPFQMLLGKVLGVGSAGLAQMAIWVGSIYVLTSQREAIASALGYSSQALSQLPIPTMSGSLLIVFLIYFVLGFLLYGALYAAIGSMCNTVQETQQYATVVTVIIVLGFLSMFSMIQDPTGTMAVALSFVPFFSPFTMPVRWSLATVPWSQLALSLALMIVALLACVWLAGRIYHTGILMYGKKPGIREIWRWVRTG